MNRLLLQIACCIVFITCAILPAAHCQEYPMKHYSIEDGLPSNTVYSVYRDSKGFLWIATDKGIARYNGLRFDIFTTFNGLPDNSIFFFREDHIGRLWLGTFNGELCYYKDGSFHTAENTPFLKLPFKTSFINQITVEKDKSINIIFYDKSRFVNIKDEKCTIVELLNLTNSEVMETALHRLKLAENKYEIFTTNKVVFVDTLRKTESVINVDHGACNGGPCETWGITSCQNQDYVINESYIFNPKMQLQRSISSKFYKNNLIYQIYANALGMFFATNNGVFLNDSTRFLAGIKISALTQDINGNYWASSFDNGLYQVDRDFIHSKVYRDKYGGGVKYTYADDTRIFFVNDKNDLYKIESNKVSLVNNYNLYRQNGITYQLPSAVAIDANYNFYNCNYEGIVQVKDICRKPFNVEKFYSNTKHSDVFRSAITVGDSLFINAGSSIFTINGAKLNLYEEPRYHIIDDTVKNDLIFTLAKARDNSIWYATVKNVFQVINGHCIPQPQFKNITFKTFDFFGDFLVGYTPRNKLLVCHNVKGDMTIDSVSRQNCIWDKLYRLDETHILISTNNLYRLLTLDAGNTGTKFSIWPVENQFVPLQAEAVISDSGNCYFFKNGTITTVKLNSLLEAHAPPSLVFASLRAGPRLYKVETEVKIPYKESRNISISFLPCSFSDEKLICQYSISKNGQESWRRVKGDEINLINTGYGKYVIKVRARTASSDYCQPIEMILNIKRPFWAEWLLWAVWVSAVIIIIALLVRRRIMFSLRKKEIEHLSQVKFLKSEYKALNALMNPHFIFNTLNNLQALYNSNDKLAANKYMRIFADLIRQNMHNVSKELITLEKEINLINNYLLLEKLRFEDKLNYGIEVDPGIDLSDIVVPPLLLQPLVENSIKHGILPMKSGKGYIHVNVYEKNSMLHIEVKDNGIGFSSVKDQSDQLHQSFGISNIRQRIEKLSVILNKKITFNIGISTETNQTQWTIVTISMPVL